MIMVNAARPARNSEGLLKDPVVTYEKAKKGSGNCEGLGPN
jgi:hypothetical protein